jgi:hypothetical protein
MRPSKVFVLGVIAVVLVAGGVGATAAVGTTPTPIASVFDGTRDQPGNAAEKRESRERSYSMESRVSVAGTAGDAILRRNGFYYQLPAEATAVRYSA